MLGLALHSSARFFLRLSVLGLGWEALGEEAVFVSE